MSMTRLAYQAAEVGVEMACLVEVEQHQEEAAMLQAGKACLVGVAVVGMGEAGFVAREQVVHCNHKMVLNAAGNRMTVRCERSWGVAERSLEG